MRQILDAFILSLKTGEHVKFESAHGNGLGEIISGDCNTITLWLFKAMNLEILQCYYLRPTTNEDEAIVDVAFILPIKEFEYGMFHLSETDNTYCIRYIFIKNVLSSCWQSLNFSRYLVELLSIHLFMNSAQHSQKALIHQCETSILKKSFWLPLLFMEAYLYLIYRLAGNSLGVTLAQKQRIVRYYNISWMEGKEWG